jgi:hypothetical protein
MGCFGPGNWPTVSQTCSANPRVCTETIYAEEYVASESTDTSDDTTTDTTDDTTTDDSTTDDSNNDTTDDTWSDGTENYYWTVDTTLAGCLAFAAEFDNTCTDLTTAYSTVADIPGVSKTCPSVGSCIEGASGDADSCTWERKLCITCTEDSNGVVYVRAQSNGLPNHCYKTPEQFGELDFDMEVKWMTETEPVVTEEEVIETYSSGFTRNLQPGGDGNGPPPDA